MKTTCKGKTRGVRFPYPHYFCSNKEWKDGYCKIHHPEEKRRKQKERDDKRYILYQAMLKRKYNTSQK